ncbi:diguanylate cyclase [Aggregicoccus sp. 17bor-14]|uniref:GGDEF domain-containing response regulator n=1 Tax=Myxococcaceae TaxID=31 RepID=UPI00129C45AD|nr:MULTISPECIES: diguanylate cyclase [Myxococcaceae]MBF5040963.1 diguanylate cyclase [Simulacricoccus sp. 17bor-14]MRI86751.1 diguanylate cyclase [Aggregicoccus sp. 17bor-14]
MDAYALIADSDPRRLELYSGIVQQQGLQPVLVRDGDAARLALRKHGAPALLVTDLSLPRCDGFALLSELRKLAPEDKAPAVVVSAFLELRNAAFQRRTELGISELLAKSAPADSVNKAIVRALVRPKSVRPAAPASPPAPPTAPRASQDPRREVAMKEAGLMSGAPQDAGLERILRETAAAMGTSMALISLVARDRQYFEGHFGLPAPLAEQRGTPVEWAFCRHVVDADVAEPLVVPDAAQSPVFRDNPLVRDFGVRSYAGAPLVTPSGAVLGTLCVLDQRPLALGAEQVDALQGIARRVGGELELRSRSPGADPLDRTLAALMQALRTSGAGEPLTGALSYVREVFDALDVGMVLYDGRRQVILANRSAGRFIGAEPQGLTGLTREGLVETIAALAVDPADLRRRMHVLPSGPFAARDELELLRPERRTLRWVARPVRLPDGSDGQIAIFTDITVERRLQEEHARLASTDPLTGLWAGAGAEDALAREFSRARRYGSPLAIALLDVDHLRRVNEQLGRSAGDRALKEVSDVLKRTARNTDVLIRWGGEEFVALLPGVGLQGGREFLKRLQAAVAAVDVGAETPLTLSAGLAELRPEDDLQALLLRADTRLYEAKSVGGNTVR